MVMEAKSAAGAAGQDAFGRRIIELAARLAQWSDTADGLTCTYFTPAHRAVAAELRDLMRAAGMTAEIDGVGNVVGRYAAADPAAKTLIIASHYDTVVNAGSYDGRLGILTGLLAVEELRRSGRRLPFHIDVIGFAEEEGVRFAAHYIGSSAIAGRFEMRLLQHRDAGGQSVADVIHKAGFNPKAIPSLARRPQDLLGYLEVHIEQGPVLLQEGLPVGIVTSIAGTARYSVTITGMAGHAGTVPMPGRRDAAAAAAEIVLYVERRCAAAPTLVGTVGRLNVPGGAINVIPGRCDLSLDIRAGRDRAHRQAPQCDDRGQGDPARPRCSLLARIAGATCHGSGARWHPATLPAERRRARCRKLQRRHRHRDAVRALRQRRHQPFPAGDDHRRRRRYCHPHRARFAHEPRNWPWRSLTGSKLSSMTSSRARPSSSPSW
jgi:hydantoinase/carbamoylase family amidase